MMSPLWCQRSFSSRASDTIGIYASIPDSKNEDTIRKDGIEHSSDPDIIFIQSFELTCQCFANFRIFCKHGLDLKEYSFSNHVFSGIKNCNFLILS